MDNFTYINSSLLISHRPLNSSQTDKTVYAICAHIPAGLFFYLSLGFLNMFLGIPGNVIVLWLIQKKRRESSTSDIFIAHLSVLDVCFCLIFPLEFASIVYLTTSTNWYVLRFFYGVKDFSPLFLSCISLDRYLAVMHPIIFTKLKDTWHRPVCIGVTWFVILVCSAGKCVGTFPDFDRVFTVMILTVFVFMVFCNISILRALRQSAPGRDKRHPIKKKACKMVLIILMIVVFNYLPPVVLYPFQDYFSPDIFKCYIQYIVFGFMDLSSVIQPILYLSQGKLPACCCSGVENDTERANADSPANA
ncbi:uracil nucleotide/cysteinyl leukotriene receptor-like [Paramisgurnus dabryanus]|uniref:uracil nucleotide/cysteinyl leukotriene receptor-like n=1 Tax=Paramisgurnus dabryanus TaxID=90735 RepID=UPI0031F3E34D